MAYDAQAGKTASDRLKQTLWTAALLGVFFAAALFIRAFFNFDVSWNDGDFRWSGTDGYYHTRVVDHLLATGEFLLRDGLINYPIGAVNPRPPFFVWTLAATGAFLAKLGLQGGDAAAATALVSAFSPAVWGALTVFPLYFLGKELFGRRAGIWAAFLLAFTASHIQRSSFGALDHDATILFFLVLGALFFTKSLKTLHVRTYVDDYRDASGVAAGLAKFFRTNQSAVAYAALTGVAFGAIALTWKGYPYAFAVFAVWYGFQLLSNHFRRLDSTSYMMLALVTFAVTLLMIWPYYEAVDRVRSAVYPALYILVGIIGASLIFVPTRHLPPVLVLPATAGGIVLGLLLMVVVFPQVGNLFFTGLGYFVQTKLYSTIAEAQRTELGFLVFSVGVIPFFFALAGIFYALSSFVKKGRDDHLFILVWAGISLFMAFTASRFVFNATAAFALLAGWLIDRFVQWIRFGEISKVWRSVRSAGTGLARSTKQAVRPRHFFAVLFLGFLLVLPNVWLAVDAGIPGAYVNDRINSKESDAERQAASEFWSQYFGAFGQSFLPNSWAIAMDYLADQDTDIQNEADRPGFIAWWDYGFYSAQRGDHPAVADPFQFGYQLSGRVLAAQSENEALVFQGMRLLEGDVVPDHDFEPETRAYLDGLRDGLADDIRGPLRARNYDAVFAQLEFALTDGGTKPLDDQVAVDFFREARDLTNRDIRYFALDGRMFPCDDPRTNGVDAASIFYAPVFLSDKNPDDFVQTTYRDGQETLYKLKIYETTADGGSRQLDTPYVEDTIGNQYLISAGRLFPMAPDGSIDFGHSQAQDGIPIANEELTYYEDFYNSLFYRAWIGPAPADPTQKVASTQEYAPGQGLKHYRLVFSTIALPETFAAANMCGAGTYAGGVIIHKYYDGAPVSGTVVDESGEAIPGAEVRVEDNFGIYHDVVETDGTGAFTILAPFSTDVTEESDLAVENIRPGRNRGTGPNALVVLIDGVEVTRETFSVSDAQAMRLEPYTATHTLAVADGSASGHVFRDANGDGVFDAANETAIEGATVDFGDGITATSAADGAWAIAAIRPGSHEVRVSAEGHVENLVTVQVGSAEETTQDIPLRFTPVDITGTLTHNGAPVEGVRVSFTSDAGAARQSSLSDVDGVYTEGLSPATWTISVDFDTEEDGVQVRYFTSESTELIVSPGDPGHTVDLVLEREEVEA